jgi:uncharacterized protein YoxC
LQDQPYEERTGFFKPWANSFSERAHDNYNTAIHKIKVALGQEEPTVTEKANRLLDDLQLKMSHMASMVPKTVGNAKDAADDQVTRMKDATWQQLHNLQLETDKSLKALGIKDKSTMEKVEDSLSRTFHDFAVSTGLKEPTLLDRAQGTYHNAIHKIKVSLGQEEPTVSEKASQMLDDVSSKMSNLAASVPRTISGAKAGADHEVQKLKDSAWQQLQNLQIETDKSLKALGIRDKSTLEKVEDSLSRTFHDFAVSSGLKEPSFFQRMTDSLPGFGHSHKTVIDKAHDNYNTAIHKIKVSLGQEEPTVAEKANKLLDDIQGKMSHLASSMSANVPHIPTTLHDAKAGTEDQLLKMKESTWQQLQNLQAETDKSLKALGIRDKSTMEKVQDSITHTFHDFAVSTGLRDPTLMERVADAIPGRGHKSMLERAQSSYDTAIHKVKIALGKEEPTVTEKANKLLDDLQSKMFSMASTMSSHMPKSIDDAKAEADLQWRQFKDSTLKQLQTLQLETDKSLKQLGIRDKSRLARVTDSITGTFHDFAVATGLVQPSLLERTMPTHRSILQRAQDSYENAIHKLRVSLGREEPTVAEKASVLLDDLQSKVSSLASSMASYTPQAMDNADAEMKKLKDMTWKQLQNLQTDADKRLKALGIRDQSTLERMQDSLQRTFHDFAVTTGLQEPSMLDRAHGFTPSLPNVQNWWNRMLLMLHLRQETTFEKMNNEYEQNIAKLVKRMKNYNVPKEAIEEMRRSQDNIQQALNAAKANLGTGANATVHENQMMELFDRQLQAIKTNTLDRLKPFANSQIGQDFTEMWDRWVDTMTAKPDEEVHQPSVLSKILHFLQSVGGKRASAAELARDAYSKDVQRIADLVVNDNDLISATTIQALHRAVDQINVALMELTEKAQQPAVLTEKTQWNTMHALLDGRAKMQTYVNSKPVKTRSIVVRTNQHVRKNAC